MNDTASPQISVIVPVYNVQDYVGPCLTSLQRQTFQTFEVIVVNDGSTDESGARAREAVAGDPRFLVIDQENRGLSGARNCGLDRARGDFVAFVDSDDTVSPDYLARLHQALLTRGADWVACGIRFRDARGTLGTHSAIHDAPSLCGHAVIQSYPLQDWKDVIRHFPSAWNKLYKRALIGDVRFDEGTWFEDHTFFYRLAQRTDCLLHVPEPLYIQTRNRDGQITQSDDPRVFQQLEVLDAMRQIMQAPPEATETAPKTGADQAFSNIASRLLYERGFALKDPKRRADFARAAVQWLEARTLEYTPGWDRAVQHSWALEMKGVLPVSIVVPWCGRHGPLLRATLESLSRGNASPGREILIVCDSSEAVREAEQIAAHIPTASVLKSSGRGAAVARNYGADAARGQYLCFLSAGDVMLGDSLGHWVETMIRHDADFGVARYRLGLSDDPDLSGAEHSAFHDLPDAPPRLRRTGLMGVGPNAEHLETAEPAPAPPEQMALSLTACPSAKIYRRAFLQDAGLRFGRHAKSGWPLVLGAALLAPRSVYIAEPGVVISQQPEAQSLTRRRLSAFALIRAHHAFPKSLPPAARQKLPAHWRSRLFSRAVWESLQHASNRTSRFARLWFASVLVGYRLLTTIGLRADATLYDPFIGPKTQMLSRPWTIVKRVMERHKPRS